MTFDIDAAERVMRRGRVVMLAGLLAVAGIYVLALRYTPPERMQGLAFKILYVHAPSAWTMELAFVLVGVVGALYFWLQDPRLDIFAEASATVGMAFGTVLLTTGPIWGKAIWGAWWAWDPRLTFTLLLYLLFAGYFALRSALRDPVDRARFGAVIGIMGTLLVPFIHLTVYLFNSQHPRPVLMMPAKSPLPWILLRPLLWSFAAFTLLYIGFVMTRYGIGLKRAALEARDAE
ncbi:MAG TPA: cytochrome c biogenesis protein CcsA [Gemmatimonadales bacterium]|jgi:heme exporter protein C